MILVGNQCGGGKNLALHLMKDENERVHLHQIRGFASVDLEGAFQESYAMSRATKCKQHLFSLSLNPPIDADLSDKEFEKTVDRAEERLGLQGQPRAIVFHTKNGRKHAHAVWCRIDTDEMKAVQLSFSRRKMQDLSRELYREHGWTMPRGFVRHEERDPRNFTLAEWQQCKRAKRDPAKTKEIFQDAWTVSDSRAAFANALKAHGLILAQGDRRGHVAVDHNGEAYAVSKYVGIKAKQVRDRLGDPKQLIGKTDAHRIASDRVNQRLAELRQQEKARAKQHTDAIARQRADNEARQTRTQAALNKRAALQAAELKQAQEARLRKGFIGLLDRMTGKRRRTLEQNRAETEQAKQKVQQENEALRQQYVARQQAIANQHKEALTRAAYIRRELAKDAKTLETRFLEASTETKNEPSKKRSANRPQRRSRNRDGPNFDR